MENIKKYKLIILITLVFLGGCFYWFELRPIQIKKECAKDFKGLNYYKICLLKNGLDI